MINRPFDLSVSTDDLQSAGRWWESLSINQMKTHRDKYFPNQNWCGLGKRWIHQIWEEEGKPPTISVTPSN